MNSKKCGRYTHAVKIITHGIYQEFVLSSDIVQFNDKKYIKRKLWSDLIMFHRRFFIRWFYTHTYQISASCFFCYNVCCVYHSYFSSSSFLFSFFFCSFNFYLTVFIRRVKCSFMAYMNVIDFWHCARYHVIRSFNFTCTKLHTNWVKLLNLPLLVVYLHSIILV